MWRTKLLATLALWPSLALAQGVQPPIIPPAIANLLPLNNTWTGTNTFVQPLKFYANNVSGNPTYLAAVNAFGGQLLYATAGTNAIVGAAVQDGSNGNSFPTGLTGYGYLNNAGNSSFGIFGRSDCYTAGNCVNELDSFNFAGAVPNIFPANQSFGTTQILPISLIFGSFGSSPSYAAMYIAPPSISGTQGYLVDGYYGYGSATYGIVMDATTSIDIPNPIIIRTTGISGHIPIVTQVMNAGVSGAGMIEVLNSSGVNVFTVDQLGTVSTPVINVSGAGPGSIKSTTNSNNFLDAGGGSSGQWTMRAGATPTTVYTATASLLTVGVPLTLTAIPSSAGSGGLYVCIDTSGSTYKKSACP